MANASFRRYAPTIATVLVVALCVSAGNWQRSRMAAKQALRAQHDAAVAAPPLRSDELPRGTVDWAALRYRSVELEGEFDAARRILLDNRVQAGQVGYEVLVPLRLADGRIVIVDRGWVAQGRTRADVPDVPVPQGTRRVHGRIELPPKGYLELGAGVPRGIVWQNLDLRRLESAWGVQLLPIVVDEIAAPGAPDGLVRTRSEPDFGIDTHRIYMVQWYAFAALALVFWSVAHWPWRRGPAAREDSDG